MKQYYMIIDLGKCHDCNNCFMGCKDEHVDNDWAPYTEAQPKHGHRWLDIQRIERGSKGRIDVAALPIPCQHCENAPCIEAGKGAVTRREDGIVLINYQKARGNKELVKACPYGAIAYNDELDVAQKCTFCAHLLDDSSWTPAVPRCVHNCGTGAMTFASLEPEEMKKYAAEQGLEVYRPELGTSPHVYYKNLFRFTKNFVSAGILLDGECLEGATASLKALNSDTSYEQLTTCFGEFKFDALENGKYLLEVTAEGRKLNQEVTISGQSLNLGFLSL